MTAAARDIVYRGFRFPTDGAAGRRFGLRVARRGLAPGGVVRRLVHPDPAGHLRRYEWGTWTSPPVPAGFAVREVVPSWTADAPAGCWLRAELRGWHASGPATRWYALGDWTADDSAVRRTSVPGQRDAAARVETDTLVVGAATVTGWQLRLTLLRPAGARAGPVLRTAGAVASGDPVTPTGTNPPGADQAGADQAGATGEGDPVAPSTRPGPATGRVLDVPCWSQRRHTGTHRWLGGGGDGWCSPTSAAMVLAYWGASPVPRRYAWVRPPGPRPAVVHAARQCYDHAYDGTGNWSFTTAYAGSQGMDAFVTRLRSLAEAEAFVAAGIPLVLSAAYRRGEVPGLDYDTTGHLLVLVGFTATGDPIVNDPYAPDDETVRRVVPRAPFEHAWQVASGGLTYVIRPPDRPLPTRPAQPNW
ncbi:peptidase C39 family protein [Micromonospora radicis]|uniref:peptidase C39 family protein n=1 Tax=Micromonospora radicis TaxID=1894971 RepID=UPI001F16022D|nr:peptidase C39 family protein [Micromonospora radicis]